MGGGERNNYRAVGKKKQKKYGGEKVEKHTKEQYISSKMSEGREEKKKREWKNGKDIN